MKKIIHLIVLLSLIYSSGYSQKKITETCAITETDTLSFYVNKTTIEECSVIEADTLFFSVNHQSATINECLASETDTLIINPTISGIKLQAENHGILVYPNPTKGALTLDYSQMTSDLHGYKLKIVAPTGQEILTQPLDQPMINIDLGVYKIKGIYLVYTINALGELIDIKKIALE